MEELLLENWKYLLAPIICAFIGWLTNYIAVKMLFRPREPINCGLFVLYGVFPKRRLALAENMGKAIENNLINHDDLQKVLNDPTFHAAFTSVAEKKIDDFLSTKLTEIHPMLAMFITGDLKQKIHALLLAEMNAMLPEFLRTAETELQKRLVFREIIKEKIAGFSSERIEELLFAVMKREFRFIEFVGGVLGFFIGAGQSALFYFF